MNKNRTKEEIIADILSVVMKEPKKTHIMYGANLSYPLLCKYLNKLVQRQLILYRKTDEVYELTPKGKVYLSRYLEFERLKDQLETMSRLLAEQESNLAELVEVKPPLYELKKVSDSPKATNE